MQVSIFLKTGAQLPNGHFSIPTGGSVPNGFEIPGTIKYVLPVAHSCGLSTAIPPGTLMRWG